MRTITIAFVVMALLATVIPAAAAEDAQADTALDMMKQFRAATIKMMDREETEFDFQEHMILPEDPEGQFRVMAAMFYLQMAMITAPAPGEATDVTDDSAVVTMDPEAVSFVFKKVDDTWKIDMAATLEGLPEHLSALAEPDEEVIEAAKARAQTTNCLSNLRQLATAAIMYARDHDETLPDADTWMDELKPYHKNEALLKCPAAPTLEYGYAMNANLSGVKLAEVKNPASTVLFFDSTLGTRNAKCTGASIPDPARHTDGNNFVFADGHAATMPETPSFDLAAEAPADPVTHVTEDTWDDKVIMQADHVLVDFGAEWCGPCQTLKPIYKQLAGEYTDIKFVSVNTDESPNLKDKYAPDGIPTLVMFHNGEQVAQTVGFRGQQHLRDWIEGAVKQ